MIARRFKLLALVVVAATAPVWLPFTCPIQQLFMSTEKRALTTLKNRTATPDDGDYDRRVTLRALLEPGRDEQRWSEDRAAEIEGYVVAVQSAGVELANCLSFTRRDIHIDLGITADAAPRERVIAEVTPPMRDWAMARGMDWSATALQSFVGKRVRLQGWLLFDREHDEESENSRPARPGNWRATAWEVHPVTSITPVE